MSMYQQMLNIFGLSRTPEQPAIPAEIQNRPQIEAIQQEIDTLTNTIATNQAMMAPYVTLETQTYTPITTLNEYHRGQATGGGFSLQDYTGALTNENPWTTRSIYGTHGLGQVLTWDHEYFTQKNPTQKFLKTLESINPRFIKEIVVPEDIYNSIRELYKFDIDNDERKKVLSYPVSNGTIILKNERYQFCLDKYLEDVPK